MTVSKIDREGAGDTTKGRRASPTFGNNQTAISGRQVGNTPIVNQGTAGNGNNRGRNGGNVYMGPDPFAAPKAGTKA